MSKKRILFLNSILLLLLCLLVGCKTTTYTLTFDLDGGLLDGQTSYQISIKETDDNNVITLKEPAKLGYNFSGWYLDGTLYNNESIVLDRDVTLVAKWEAKSYQIVYDLDGGLLNDPITTYTIESEVTLPVPTKKGYTFLGWNEGISEIKKGMTGDLTLKAKWGLEKYTITYHLNGGVLDNLVTEFTCEDEVILNTPVKEGFDFVGWYLTEDMQGQPLTTIGKGTMNNIELFASWQAEKTISTITYVLNGGGFSVDVTLEYENGKDFTLAIPEKENYLFMGWYENKDLSGDPIEKIKASDGGDKTYYASWLSTKELFDSLIPKTATENLNFIRNHPDNNNIRISWSTSDTKTINYSGEISQGHRNIEVDVTMTLFYKESYSQYTGKVKVGPVVFEALKPGKMVAGYVYAGTLSRWGAISFEKIFDKTALETLDVVNYGFATVSKGGNLQLDNTGYMKYIDEVLKLRKHGVRVLLCIAENSANFSDMASTQAGIDKFVAQVVEAVEKYHFDGVDIDWEFPGVDSGRDVAIDRPNYTKLMKALREALDARQNRSGTPYLLTAAIPGTSWGSERYEMNVLDDYLDYVNMMSYDLNNTAMACHHTSLYTSKDARAYGFSIQYGIDRFVSMGFDKNKIVAGMAFYGKYYKNAVALGVDAKFQKNIHYTVIKNNYLNNSNFIEYWDEIAKASYLLNKTTGEFISYDSQRSIKEKCNYAKTSGIMGVMFWDYSEDTTGDLMQAINEGMNG